MISYFQDYNIQWLVACIALSGFACLYPLRRSVGWLASITVLYFFLTSANVWLNPLSSYAQITPYDLTALRMFAEDSAAKLMLVLVPMIYFSARDRRRFAAHGMIFFSMFCLIDAVVVLLQFALNKERCNPENSCGSLLGNPSMNACFLVVLLPLAMKTMDPIPRAITFFAVLASVVVSKASIPYGLFTAMACLLAAITLSRRTLSAAALGAPAVMLVGWKLLGQEFLNSGDRVPMWKFFLSKWNVPLNWVFGTGYGTFGVFSINLQQHFHMRDNGWWIWIHNDWLQACFEVGVVGVTLMFLVYARALILLWKDGLKHEAVSLTLYGLMMSMNYPEHIALTAIFGAWLAVVALTSRQKFSLLPARSPRIMPISGQLKETP